jgi:hypothetical protein
LEFTIMADVIVDERGFERRCGSLPMPVNRVCSLPPFGSDPNMPLWTEAEIKAVVTKSDREKSRDLFGAAWILDQLSYGSCNGHALAGCGARTRFVGGRRDGLLFSGAYSYSKMNGGRDNGSVILDDIDVAQRDGFCPLSLVPAQMIYPKNQPANADSEAAKYKGLECYALMGLMALRTALACRIPCIVAVMAGDNFARLNGGICGIDNGSGNHAVLVDDVLWDGTKWLYDMANSWGTRYGDGGRGYLTDGHFKQTFGPHSFVAVPAFDELR